MKFSKITSSLKNFYFQMGPLIKLDEIFHSEPQNVGDDILSNEGQKMVVSCTIDSPHAQFFPPSKVYAQKFFKYIMKKIEENEETIIDEMYEAFGKLFFKDEDEKSNKDWFTKSYAIEDELITIVESSSFVKSGTTGLQSWDSGKLLSQWCLHNKNLFKNKNIIELGCGMGLTGICICRFCGPSNYVFSDHHEQVLSLLAKNLSNNLTETDEVDSTTYDCDRSCFCTSCRNVARKLEDCDERQFKRMYSDTKVYARNLDVENADTFEFDFEPEIIVASDLLFDPDIITSVVNILEKWFSSRPKLTAAYLSTPIRSEQTLNFFLDSFLGNEAMGLKVEEMVYDNANDLFYLKYDYIPIKIYKVSKILQNVS